VLDKTPGSPTEGQLIPVPARTPDGLRPAAPAAGAGSPAAPADRSHPAWRAAPPQPQRQQPPQAGAAGATAPAAASPAMQPGDRYRRAVESRQWLIDQLNVERNPARKVELENEIKATDGVIRSMGYRPDAVPPPAPQAGPQGAPAPVPVGSPRPGPAAPTGPVYVSPEQAERDAQLNKSKNRVAQAKTTTDTVKTNIDEALSFIGLTSTGAIGAAARWAPWPTDAGRLENAVRSVQSALSFDTLQTMRENSPTGAPWATPVTATSRCWRRPSSRSTRCVMGRT